jgi:transcriptional regulator with XRE-family HTH domain
MNTVEKIKAICKERKIPISRLEKECGFANGYIGQLKKGSIPSDRLIKVSDFLGLSPSVLVGDNLKFSDNTYYVNEETAKTAQEIFENKDLCILFDAAKDARPEDLKMAAEMLRRFKESNPDG